MGRAWQFFLTVAITAAILAYFYYSSDFYAKRTAAPSLPGTQSAVPQNPVKD
jgi:hypothetical protein